MPWRQFLQRKKWDRERLLEIESYLAMEADDNMARGMSSEEAYAAARRKLGNGTRIREEIYGMNTIGWLDEICWDVRHGARLLGRNPMFTAIALLTLAVGLGANTAVFAVLNSVLLLAAALFAARAAGGYPATCTGSAGLGGFVRRAVVVGIDVFYVRRPQPGVRVDRRVGHGYGNTEWYWTARTDSAGERDGWRAANTQGSAGCRAVAECERSNAGRTADDAAELRILAATLWR